MCDKTAASRGVVTSGTSADPERADLTQVVERQHTERPGAYSGCWLFYVGRDLFHMTEAGQGGFFAMF